MKVRISPGYHGQCAKCGEDVFTANGTSEWLDFKPNAASDERMRALGFPPMRGVWQIVHTACVTPGRKLQSLDTRKG